MFNKVRKVEEIKGEATKLLAQFSYDEKGRKVRETDVMGEITRYEFDQSGKLKGKTIHANQDPAIHKALQEKEKALLSVLEGGGDGDVDGALRKLADFYLFESNEANKALELAPRLSAEKAWAVRLQAINFDKKLTPAQKIAGYETLLKKYPEKEEQLQFMIKHTTL
jgi:YD repeat-containing protein